jgi:hypothetical protein
MDVEEDVLGPEGVQNEDKHESLLSVVTVINWGIIIMNVPTRKVKMQIL